MKTVLVVYTDRKTLSKKEIARLKKYSFNASNQLRIGDIIESHEYSTNMMVVHIFEESFKYYNKVTGELSNKFNSTEQWVIRPLVMLKRDANIVFGSIVNRTVHASCEECC